MERFKKLRDVVGMSQEDVADAGGIDRLDVQQFEKGNKHNSHKVRRGLARGMNLTQDDLDDYLDGLISLEEAILRRRLRQGPKGSRAMGQ